MAKKQAHFGELLLQLREERGLRQRDVATGADLSLFTVSKQERSPECHLRPRSLHKLLQYLHGVQPITPEQLEAMRALAPVPRDLLGADAPQPGRSAGTQVLTAAAGAVAASAMMPGQLRAVVNAVHFQLMAELGAPRYLEALLRLAESLHVVLQLTPESLSAYTCLPVGPGGPVFSSEGLAGPAVAAQPGAGR